MAVDSLEELVAAFVAGSVSGADPGPFKCHETHGSMVLVSASVAYKLKKPVTFDFLDYGTVEQRGKMCRLEVELNHRLAPGIYVGAVPVFATAAGYELGAVWKPGEGGDGSGSGVGDPVEWLVVMRPIPTEGMLDRRVDSRCVTTRDLELVGRRLAEFHLGADAVDPGLASPQVLGEELADRVRALSEMGAGVLDETRLESVRRFAQCGLDRLETRLVARSEDGWIRDGHGDLRLEHIVLRNESVEVIDCVEFDPSLRAADVLSDLAFLAMELELAGRGDLVAALTGAWGEVAGAFDEDVLWFFAALKALVRVEVAIHRAAQLEPGYLHDVVTDMAKAHLALAQRLAWRAHGPIVVVVGGLSGSGKTAVSKLLAERWGLDRMTSDETRKQLVGVGRDEFAPRHAYDDYVSQVVYEHLGHATAEVVGGGGSVVVDATFRRQPDRSRFYDALSRLGNGVGRGPTRVAFELKAHHDVLRARVSGRLERGGSDADIAVLEGQIASRSTEGGSPSDCIEIETAAPVEAVVAEVELAVLERLTSS